METIRKKRSIGTGRAVGRQRILRSVLTFLSATAVLFLLSCTQLEKPEPEPFFAETAPPKVQEFRWSNGKMPRSFDPALASAPPETDVVRALYEGLTETDPATLEATAGVAESWSASDDFKVWTFKLRKNAKWSNGKPLTAQDFVRAWKRLIKLGDKTAHRSLLSNIAGVPKSDTAGTAPETGDLFLRSDANKATANSPLQQLGQPPSSANTNVVRKAQGTGANPEKPIVPGTTTAPVPLGIVAEDELTLKVTLALPDKEFPKLVANPIFRPIFSNGEEFIGKELNPTIVTNGPFRLVKVEPARLTLERSENYWNSENVKLERVYMVAMESPEKALAAYRAGELDAVTNADFSPLVLKLLSPYEDFRKTTHSALNFYEVNFTKPPFSDRRVREALSNAIERERLTESEMEGLTRPALGFQPSNSSAKTQLTQDKEKARDLLDQAGFPDGEGFPVIKLLINRNDAQQRVARSVAKMWKQNLNVETEIVVKDQTELENSRQAGEFDLVRRGIVFPTSDQTANFMLIFEPKPQSVVPAQPNATPDGKPPENPPFGGPSEKRDHELQPGVQGKDSPTGPAEPLILTEEDAAYELRAIPLYFPTSFSLVRPYVSGFEMNSLDALTLTNVTINSEWQPKAR